MLNIQHGETVGFIAWLRDDRNAHGKLTPVFADEVPIANVGVDVPDANEPRDGATNRQIVDLVLFLPPGFNARAQDRFRVRGDLYQVEGNAPPVPNFFTGAMFRTEVKVRRTSG